MERVDASERFEQENNTEPTPSLLTIILDTNPAAWALIADILPLSKAVANLLVFINAHLACNYTNKVAVIASHTDRAQWLFPTPVNQKPAKSTAGPSTRNDESNNNHHDRTISASDSDSTPSRKRVRHGEDTNDSNGTIPHVESNKYRPFHTVEEQLTRNLNNLMTSTSPTNISSESSTMIAGALTLALSYINRETIAYTESLTGKNTNFSDPSSGGIDTTATSTNNNAMSNTLQSRILLVTVSPGTDLAHQYIPIMNSIFACQRLNIPIDVLQVPLPSISTSTTTTTPNTNKNTPPNSNSDSTVFLQQAADATHGIFIPAHLQPTQSKPTEQSTSTSSSSLLTYLLTAFLPSPNTRTAMILPTRIDVDFRAACFCHRNVISIGFVCSICLSIFCDIPQGDGSEGGGEGGAVCLTCGTSLSVMGSGYGARPVVVPRKKKKKVRAIS